jgi:tRNA-dihydrouridine synthase
MAELSHRPLRELIESFGGADGVSGADGISGADEYFTEMISAGAFVAGGPFEAWYADGGPCPEKLVYQLVGRDPDQLAAAAAMLDRLDCLGIDINMGCSAPAITRQGAGVRWMADIDRAGELIRQVRAKTRRRLSVKLRTGLEDDFDYLLAFCRRLEAEGVDRVTLHPRTAREKFRRSARWDYIRLLKEGLSIPVAGNGDIANAAELQSRAESGVCDAVMVGRAAVRYPWIFASARTPDVVVDLEGTGMRFLELLARYQPPEFHISRARRFFSYFCDNLTWAHYLKTKLNREDTLSGIERVWREYFRENTG